MTGEPFFWGMPKLADPHWDRLWAMCQDAELSVNFHIGSGDMSIFERAYEGAGEHANYAGFGVQFGIANVSVIANLITGGVCHRFPNLKFVSVESGVGWLPFALEHLDWQWMNCGVPPGAPGVRPAALGVLQAPDVRLLLVRDRQREGRHRPDGSRLLPVRERLPAPDEHGARPGHDRGRTSPVHRRGTRRPPDPRSCGPCCTTTRPSSTTSTDVDPGACRPRSGHGTRRVGTIRAQMSDSIRSAARARCQVASRSAAAAANRSCFWTPRRRPTATAAGPRWSRARTRASA